MADHCKPTSVLSGFRVGGQPMKRNTVTLGALCESELFINCARHSTNYAAHYFYKSINCTALTVSLILTPASTLTPALSLTL